MKKSILITGCQGSGKITKANEIADKFNKDEVVFIYFKTKKFKDKLFFSQCTKKTKVVIIVFEDFFNIKKFRQILSFFSHHIIVNKKGEDPFNISPKFIFVCQTQLFTKNLIL